MGAVVRFYAHLCSHIHEHTALSRVWLAGVYAYAAPIAGGLLYGELKTHLGGLLISLALLSMVIMALRLRLAPCRMGTREATPTESLPHFLCPEGSTGSQWYGETLGTIC
jgi:hypothetical protein